jgi:hypothetical protein
MPTYSYDGHGINDAQSEFKPRLATLTKEGHERKVGPLFAAAPDMLTALEFVVGLTNGKNRFAPKLSMQDANREWAKFVRMARKVISEAKA